jgi:hypothetical protein
MSAAFRSVLAVAKSDFTWVDDAAAGAPVVAELEQRLDPADVFGNAMVDEYLVLP